MIDLTQLACDPVHLVRTLRRAGYRPTPPSAFGPAGVSVRLHDQQGRHIGSVIVSQTPLDGADWIHASIAWTNHTPVYQDLALLKAAVFGDRREAYQVFPSANRHVNIHEHALHLWGRADGARVLPDFGAEGTI
jgi:hypothetical protein